MKKIGIYPGSFSPFHWGHLDIYNKASQIFDKVVVAVGTNPQKKDFGIDRVETIKKQLPNLKVEDYDGFLTDYIFSWEEKGYDVTVVRGLRNGVDLDYEVNQLRILKDLKRDVKMVFFPCDIKYQHISSSMIRALESIQKGAGSEYIAKVR